MLVVLVMLCQYEVFAFQFLCHHTWGIRVNYWAIVRCVHSIKDATHNESQLHWETGLLKIWETIFFSFVRLLLSTLICSPSLKRERERERELIIHQCQTNVRIKIVDLLHSPLSKQERYNAPNKPSTSFIIYFFIEHLGLLFVFC